MFFDDKKEKENSSTFNCDRPGGMILESWGKQEVSSVQEQ
ncbi:MAG: hypothetical protein ACI90V_009155 [Bacillariaceae sp.]|jgi:hypothetical protein